MNINLTEKNILINKLILLVIILLLFYMPGCNPKPPKQEKSSEQIQKEIREFNFKFDAEKYVLLSSKYDLDTETARKIIDEYIKKHDSPRELIDITKKDQKTIESKFNMTLTELSHKYDIPKQKIASFIVDFRLWSTCENYE